MMYYLKSVHPFVKNREKKHKVHKMMGDFWKYFQKPILDLKNQKLLHSIMDL